MAVQGGSSSSSSSSGSTVGNGAPALGVLVFVHGFKGDDTTFGDYPQRLQHSLSSTFGEKSKIHAWVYPAFDTRGELSQCVENFGAWLTTRIAEVEMEHASQSESGQKELARVVLIGHSMGGIVIADCARSVVQGYKAAGEQRVWPRIVGVMAYDTPYLGVHPGTFKNTATEAWSYVQQAQAVAASVGAGVSYLNSGKDKSAETKASAAKGKAPSRQPSNASMKSAASSSGKGKQKAANQDEGSSMMDITKTLSNAGKAAQNSANEAGGSWTKYAFAAAGAGALAAAAGTAWYTRQQIAATASNSQLWVTSHLEFVGVLWKTETMRERLEELLQLEDDNVRFHCFYTLLKQESRTFIVLPSPSTLPDSYIQAEKYFSSNLNSKAKNEIEAHTAMFDVANDGVYVLGQQSATMIAQWLRTDGRKNRN